MAILAADTFTRADSTSVPGATETGAITPTAVVGTWGINTNRLYASAVVTATGYIGWDVGTTDVDVSIDLPVISTGGFGIALGMASGTDMVVFQWNVVAQRLLVNRIGSGGNYYIATFAQPSIAAGATIRVARKTGVCEVFQNAVSLGRVDLTVLGDVTSTRCGLWVTSTSTRFDNLSIADSAAVDNTNNGLLYKGRDTAVNDAAGVA